MKITTKTTKEQLTSFLEESLKNLTDSNLKDRINYALEAEEDKVTKKDLGDLAKEVIKTLALDKTEPKVEPKAENSVQKLNKGISKKQKDLEEAPKKKPVPKKSEPESEETAEEPKTEPKEAEKPDEKPAKKQKPKKSKVHEVTDDDFPETLETVGERVDEKGEKIPIITTYTLAHDIQSMEDLYNALTKDEEIALAFYYSRKMLKEAPYFYNMVEAPKSFQHDLDLATTIYVSDGLKVAYHISKYTEACYSTIPEDYEELDGVRYAGTMQYQIYRFVSTEDKTEA